MNLLFTTPYQRPAIDGYATITGVRIISCILDPDALTATTVVQAIEDGPGGVRHVVTTPFTGTTTAAQILAAVKADVSAKTGMTFQ